MLMTKNRLLLNTGDNIQQRASAHPRESTAIAEFKAAYQ